MLLNILNFIEMEKYNNIRLMRFLRFYVINVFQIPKDKIMLKCKVKREHEFAYNNKSS